MQRHAFGFNTSGEAVVSFQLYGVWTDKS